MKKYLALFIAILFAAVSCGDDDSGTNNDDDKSAEWYYFSARDAHNQNYFELKRMNLESGEIESLIDSARLFDQPINSMLYYIRYSSRIAPDSGVVYDKYICKAGVDGKNPQTLVSLGTADIYRADFCGDGSKLALYTNIDFRLYDVENATSTVISANRISELAMEFSPDDSKLAFKDWNGALRIYDVASGQSSIVFEEIGGQNLEWKQDGASIFFRANIGGSPKILNADVASQVAETIVEFKSAILIFVSPGGDKLIFQELITHTTSSYDFLVWSCDLDGSKLTQVGENAQFGYMLIADMPFASDDELLVARSPLGSNAEVDQIGALNFETGEFRFIANAFE